MACFLAPTTAVIITTAVRKKIPPKYRLDWLIAMLWGGAAMLAVEHISHREVIPYPPFLTDGLPKVLPEILKAGVPMTFAIILVWMAMVLAAMVISEKRTQILTT